jgi:TrmH family RNA methyltransferase
MQQIVSKENSRIKFLKKLYRKKAFRDEQKMTILEGYHLFESCRKSAVEIDEIFCSKFYFDLHINDIDQKLHKKIFVLEEPFFNSISEMKSPNCFLTTIKTPPAIFNFNKLENGLYFYLDGIQDPGNMGSILRTSQAAGNKGIFLSPNCADPWSPKTLRGSQGCQFDIPIVENISDDKILNMDLNIFLSDANGQNILNFQFPKKTLIIFGAEGKGFSEAFKDNRLKSIAIPMDDTVESLNVANASSIISYLFLNQFKA